MPLCENTEADVEHENNQNSLDIFLDKKRVKSTNPSRIKTGTKKPNRI